MNKRYVVYYQWDQVDEGSKGCIHNFDWFDTIEQAVSKFNSLGTKNKQILKVVTWKTEITDITEKQIVGDKQ